MYDDLEERKLKDFVVRLHVIISQWVNKGVFSITQTVVFKTHIPNFEAIGALQRSSQGKIVKCFMGY